MTSPTIDLARCGRDGLCARVCPTAILRVGANGLPGVHPHTGVVCYGCGNCASVCPREAISASGASPRKLEPLRPGWRLDPDRVGQLLRGRRSTRAFKAEPLPRQVLVEIMATVEHGAGSTCTRWPGP